MDFETGCITDVNPFLVELLGFSHREMVGRTVGELSPFRDIDSNQAMLARLQQDGYVRYEDLPLKTTDDRHIAVEFVSNVYPVGNRKVIQCNIRDITERKQAQEEIPVSTRSWSNVSPNAPRNWNRSVIPSRTIYALPCVIFSPSRGSCDKRLDPHFRNKASGIWKPYRNRQNGWGIDR